MLLHTLEFGSGAGDTLRRQAQRAGQSIERLENAPELEIGLQLYLQAYFDLDSDRPVAFGGTPRIPHSAVRVYADFYGFDEEQADALSYFVGELDSKFIDYRKKKEPKTTKHGKPRRSS